MTDPADDPLLAGYRRWRDTAWPLQTESHRRLARRGQKPRTAVLTCSDARIDPQTIFDAQAGELFVIRNVAGLAPTYQPDGGCHGTSAALEYAVMILKVRRLVVLGHADCDGVHAMVHGPLRDAQDFLSPWMDIAEPVMWPIPDVPAGRSLQEVLEREVAQLSLRNLRTFPWIAAAERSGRLTLSAFLFDIGEGALHRLGEA